MNEDNAPVVEQIHRGDEPGSVVIRPSILGAVCRAASSAPVLALVAIITATATMLSMSVATDISDAKLYSSRGFSSLAAIQWAAGSRLIVAGLALLLAIAAGARYTRALPATRIEFHDDVGEPVESTEGEEPAGWVSFLVGSAAVVSVVAAILNAVALTYALGLHQSPNFGLPSG